MNIDQFLMPVNSTDIKPLDIKSGYAIIWDKTKWIYIEDNRGLKYWLLTDKWNSPYRVVTNLGKLPENILLSPPEKTQDEFIHIFNNIRFSKLFKTDYLVMVDYPLDESIKNNILEYRQQLRDMPALEGYPWDGGDINTPWPKMPKMK